MSTSILSLGLFLFALALCAVIALVAVAALGGNVFHAWGSSSTLEWLAEAVRRVFTGSLRRRLMRKVNSQALVNVDGSRQAFSYLVITVCPDDAAALTGPGGSRSRVAAAAAKGYARRARVEGWTSETAPQVTMLVDESLRRGNIRVRPVQREQFLELSREVSATNHQTPFVPAPARVTPTRVDDHVVTRRLEDRDSVTEVAQDPAYLVTLPAESSRLVLTDARGVEHLICTPSALVGRGRECVVRVESTDVSREHVDVYVQEGAWWLRDLGSRNGTTVDGREVKGAGLIRLAVGSRIVMGGKKAGESLTVAGLVTV